MTNAFFPSGFRATTDDGHPLAGGTYRFYAAETTTPKEVFADAERTISLGSAVNINSSGEAVTGSNVQTMIYPGIGDYRVRLYDANNVPIFDQDGIPGAVEDQPEAESALPVTPVISLTTSGTHTLNDRGTLFNLDPTGGAFSRTLPSALTAGDGFRIGFRHNGAANQASVVAPGTQNIRAQTTRKSFALVGMGETAWFVSNGADWVLDSYSPPFWKATAPYFRVLDRVSSAPVNPDPGARYLINNPPTGVWSQLGFAENDIAEADGNGSWLRLTPETGWMAFDADESQTLQFKDGAWENFQIDPGTSTLKRMVVQDQRTSGTNGGNATTGSWNTVVLNTVLVNTLNGASLASNVLTLSPGRYEVEARKPFYRSRITLLRFKTADDDSIVIRSENIYSGEDISTQSGNANVAVIAALSGEFEVTGDDPVDFVLEYRVGGTDGGNVALGRPAGIEDTPEVYATVVIKDLASLQGPKGDQGDQGIPGVQGVAGVSGPTGSTVFDYNSTTTDADPGDGVIRFNNVDLALATEAYIDNQNRGGVNVSSWLDMFDDTGTSTLRGFLLVQLSSAPVANFRLYGVAGSVVDGTGYRKVSLSHINGGGLFGNSEELIVTFVPGGPPGSLELGSNLDLDGNDITGTGNINITGSIASSGPITQGGTPVASRDLPPITLTGASETATLSHGGHIVEMNSGSANAYTVPPNSSVAFPIGTIINVVQIGAGVTTIAADTGVTLNGESAGSAEITDRYQGVSLYKRGTDEWIMSGAHEEVAP